MATGIMATAGHAAGPQPQATVQTELVLTAARKRVEAPPRKPERVAFATLASTPVIPGKLNLQSGALEARIENADHGAKVRAGASAFIDVILANTSPKRARNVELLLQGTGARLVRVQGKGIKSRRTGAGRVITVYSIPQKSERSLILELRLDGTDSGKPRKGSLAAVNLALKNAKTDLGNADHTRLEWRVMNPARDYHRALRKLDTENGEEIYASVQDARAGNPDLPGRWLFKPVSFKSKRAYKITNKTVSVRYCTRYRRATRKERRRARNRGRRVRRICSRRATRKVTRKIRTVVKRKPDPVGKEERRLIVMAGNAVSSRGAAPLLRKRSGRFGWISSRIAIDLRTYMGQKPHPALCTGMDVGMDYLYDNATSFRRRIGDMHASRERAPEIAALRIRTLREQLQRLPGGHPGWGAAPLAILTEFPEDADVLMTLNQMAGHVISLTVSFDEGARVGRETNMIDVLQRAARALKSPEFSAQPANIQRSARRALTMIEAAYYLRLGDNHYVRLEKALFG
ncbi:MAG: hypothetical protein ACR2O4_02305, partial [Hyphomicrobiaceae bacterium]